METKYVTSVSLQPESSGNVFAAACFDDILRIYDTRCDSSSSSREFFCVTLPPLLRRNIYSHPFCVTHPLLLRHHIYSHPFCTTPFCAIVFDCSLLQDSTLFTLLLSCTHNYCPNKSARGSKWHSLISVFLGKVDEKAAQLHAIATLKVS